MDELKFDEGIEQQLLTKKRQEEATVTDLREVINILI